MNPHKGEVELKAGDKVYVLRFSIDAICQIEASTDKPFSAFAGEIADRPEGVSVTMVRMLLHAALQERHPEIDVKEAGEMIIVAGGLTVVAAKVFEALTLAFPQPEASGTSRPPNRAAPRKSGTGPAS